MTGTGSSNTGESSRSSYVRDIENMPAQIGSNRQASHAVPLPCRNSFWWMKPLKSRKRMQRSLR